MSIDVFVLWLSNYVKYILTFSMFFLLQHCKCPNKLTYLTNDNMIQHRTESMKYPMNWCNLTEN